MGPIEIPPIAVPAANRSAAIAAHLERLITNGAIPPGSRLPSERELSTKMQVSRASLREAMHELEQKRLIQRTPGRGTIVMDLPDGVTEMRALASDASMQDYASELRLVIEPQIAGLAAARATQSSILMLHEVVNGSHPTLAPHQSMELDVDFHRLLAQAARNPLLSGLHTMMTEWTRDLRLHSHATAKGRRHSVAGHQEILAAVDAHDAIAAEAAMRAHLGDVRELIADETSGGATDLATAHTATDPA